MSAWGVFFLGMVIGALLGFGAACIFQLGAESDTRIKPEEHRDERR